MRFRPWLMLAGPVAVLALTALPAAAQSTGFDQSKMLYDMTQQLPTPADHLRQWLEVGVSIPVNTFDDRGWDPGLLLRWNQEVWTDGPVGLVGSLGFAFNDRSRFNEAQADLGASAGFDDLDTVSVLSYYHLAIPFAVQLQFDPARMGRLSPFLSGGPAVQYTWDTRVRQRYYAVTISNFESFVCPITTYNPPAPALIADRHLSQTHFHLGYEARAGVRARLGSEAHPLHMRITASIDTWYEHDRPVSYVGGSLSFGR